LGVAHDMNMDFNAVASIQFAVFVADDTGEVFV
jgi:hypothetical protein